MKKQERNDAWFNCICAECGTRFHKSQAKLEECKTHYCSRECRRKKEAWAKPAKQKSAKLPMCELKEGCRYYGEMPYEECCKCGFYRPEAVRRANMKFERGPDGLLRIKVGPVEEEPE